MTTTTSYRLNTHLIGRVNAFDWSMVVVGDAVEI
jgi:hypothetical protein